MYNSWVIVCNKVWITKIHSELDEKTLKIFGIHDKMKSETQKFSRSLLCNLLN